MFWDRPPYWPRFFDQLQEYDHRERRAYEKWVGKAGRLIKRRAKYLRIRWKDEK